MSSGSDGFILPDLVAWPSVTAIIPARNESAVIAETVTSLIMQDYQGALSIILVDDQSTDGTTQSALQAARQTGNRQALTVIAGQPLQSGWTGKLFALQQGLEATHTPPYTSTYLWLTDADIRYHSETLSTLVKRAESGGHVLTSLMAELRCVSLAERALIPAFIFFFQMLYPFGWVNRQGSGVAAAAGGCMLLRREALLKIGGFSSIREALIDDCALAAKLKEVGPIWLGLTHRAISLRRYDRFDQIRQMVARSAYAQLRYSPLYLAATAVGMIWIYELGPALAIFAHGLAAAIGWVVWAVMALLFVPSLRFYRLSPLWALALPFIALVYLAFTLDSAYQYKRGRGGLWKGRVQAARTE